MGPASSSGKTLRSPDLEPRIRQQELSVGPIQHIEQTVPIGLQNQLTILPGKHPIREDQVLGGIPVMTIAGSELIASATCVFP